MKQFGLPKSCLLRKTGEFSRVYRFGQRVKGDGYSVLYLLNDQPVNRLGVSVHRKTGKAVRRNRIKRIVREVFRLNRQIFPPCCDIVITIRPDFSFKNVSDFQSNLFGLIGNSGYIE